MNLNPIAKLLESGQPLRREIHPEIRIIDEGQGICDYVASDETLDAYSEIIRVNGWQFTRFAKNAPFVDSHDYSTIGKLLGKVLDYRIEGGKLVERVQWAKDDPNTFAGWGWKMTVGGFLKAVSVGFYPTKYVTKWDTDQSGFIGQMKELGLSVEQAAKLCCVYVTQEQIELSSCIIGANPNALAKSFQSIARAHKAGCLNDEDLDSISAKIATAQTALPADSSAAAERATRRKQLEFLMEITRSV